VVVERPASHPQGPGLGAKSNAKPSALRPRAYACPSDLQFDGGDSVTLGPRAPPLRLRERELENLARSLFSRRAKIFRVRKWVPDIDVAQRHFPGCIKSEYDSGLVVVYHKVGS